MTEWHDIKKEPMPKDEILLFGCESDPSVDRHMFFIDIGYAYKDGMWSLIKNATLFPSHWARITSPIESCPVTHYGRIDMVTYSGYFINEG